MCTQAGELDHGINPHQHSNPYRQHSGARWTDVIWPHGYQINPSYQRLSESWTTPWCKWKASDEKWIRKLTSRVDKQLYFCSQTCSSRSSVQEGRLESVPALLGSLSPMASLSTALACGPDKRSIAFSPALCLSQTSTAHSSSSLWGVKSPPQQGSPAASLRSAAGGHCLTSPWTHGALTILSPGKKTTTENSLVILQRFVFRTWGTAASFGAQSHRPPHCLPPLALSSRRAPAVTESITSPRRASSSLQLLQAEHVWRRGEPCSIRASPAHQRDKDAGSVQGWTLRKRTKAQQAPKQQRDPWSTRRETNLDNRKNSQKEDSRIRDWIVREAPRAKNRD